MSGLGPACRTEVPPKSSGAAVGVDDGLSKGLRCLLRQIVADATGDQAIVVPARELLGIGAWVWMRRAIGVAFHRDRRHVDDRSRPNLLFELLVFRFALGEPEPPAVIVDRDRDMILVGEGRRAAVEGGVVELPLR